MTEKNAKNLIKIAKFLVIALFIMFFVIILIQSINISTLKSKQNYLQNQLTEKQTIYNEYNSEINYIENNKDKYSEEELRKQDYIKQDEILVK